MKNILSFGLLLSIFSLETAEATPVKNTIALFEGISRAFVNTMSPLAAQKPLNPKGHPQQTENFVKPLLKDERMLMGGEICGEWFDLSQTHRPTKTSQSSQNNESRGNLCSNTFASTSGNRNRCSKRKQTVSD